MPRRPAKTKFFSAKDDEVISVGHAETKGDEIILDKIVDDNGEGSARMLTFTMLASLAALATIVIAAIIKILH